VAKFKIFVDGREGTTGLEIDGRLAGRDDIEILAIDPKKRKDPNEKKKYMNSADVVFLCLPDEAAVESAALVDNPETRVIDASTAHRVADGWVYGLPELSSEHRQNVQKAKRLSNPGCFATGFAALMYPLVKEHIIPAAYPVCCHSVTGYSGGGRRLIEMFESRENEKKWNSPCFYALNLRHKHLPEMQKHSRLEKAPIFTPIIGKYYRGMTVAVPLCLDQPGIKANAAQINEFYRDYYHGENFVKVMPFGIQGEFEGGYMDAEGCNYTNNLEIMTFGDDEQLLLAARLDNLGKGASGAAVQNMNIMLGIEETYGLLTMKGIGEK